LRACQESIDPNGNNSKCGLAASLPRGTVELRAQPRVLGTGERHRRRLWIVESRRNRRASCEQGGNGNGRCYAGSRAKDIHGFAAAADATKATDTEMSLWLLTWSLQSFDAAL